jgi:hypothetical protein
MIKKITLLFALITGTLSYGQGENAIAINSVKGMSGIDLQCATIGGKGVIKYPQGWYNAGTAPDPAYGGESVDANWKWNQKVTDLSTIYFTGETGMAAVYPGNGDAEDVNAMISINNTTDFELKAYNKRATNNTLSCTTGGNKVVRYSLKLKTPFVNSGDERTVTLTLTDKDGKSEDIVLTATYDLTASVDQLEKFNFSYAPNPTKDFIQLSAANPIQGVQIYNLLGQEVLQNTYNLRNAKLDVSALNEGVYVLKVIINDNIGTYKFMKE